ncbi:MAG: glycosyltransferase family 39 protein [Planctomycetes bacterium]|nr:glycosyltransferase family 39 protein [Planctomycetota bacterium]
MSRFRGESLLFGLVAALASFLRHLPRLDRPFGLDLEGVMGGRFQAAFCKAWDLGGFFALDGRPLLAPLPTMPMTGELYANHPPLYHWASFLFYRSFGRDEFALRLLPALCCAVLAFLVLQWLRSIGGRTGALVALALVLVAPMVDVYGAMANYESPLILLSFAAYRLLPAGRIGPGRGLAVAGLMFLAVGQDWPALFILPAILASRLAERRPFLRPMLWLGAGAAAALLAYGLLLVSWKGGFTPTGKALDLALHSGRQALDWDLLALLKAQLRHLRRGYGILMIATLLVALLAAWGPWAGSRRVRYRMGLAWCLAALVYVFAFPARALDHEFCWFYPLPGLLLLVATLADDLVARLRRPRAILAAGLVLVASFVASGLEAARSRPLKEMPPEFLELAAEANELTGRRALVLTPRIYAAAWFYFQAWIIENVNEPADIERGIEAFVAGKLDVDRIVVEIPPALGPAWATGLVARHGGRLVEPQGIPIWILER